MNTKPTQPGTLEVPIPHGFYTLRAVKILADKADVDAQFPPGKLNSLSIEDEETLAHVMECKICLDDLEDLIQSSVQCAIAGSFMSAFLAGDLHNARLNELLSDHYATCPSCGLDFLYSSQFRELSRLSAEAPRKAAVVRLALSLFEAGLTDQPLVRQTLKLWLNDDKMSAEVVAHAVSGLKDDDIVAASKRMREFTPTSANDSATRDADREIAAHFVMPRVNLLVEPGLDDEDSWLMELKQGTTSEKRVATESEGTQPEPRPKHQPGGGNLVPLFNRKHAVAWRTSQVDYGSERPALAYEGPIADLKDSQVLLEWVDSELYHYLNLSLGVQDWQQGASHKRIAVKISLNSDAPIPQPFPWVGWITENGDYETTYEAKEADWDILLSDPEQPTPPYEDIRRALEWLKNALEITLLTTEDDGDSQNG